MDLTLLIVTCLINLMLGAIILSRDSSRAHARIFFFLTLAVSLWVTANYFTNHYYGSKALVELANGLAYMFGYTVVVLGLTFTYYFPIVRKPTPKHRGIVLTLVGTTLLLSLTPLVAGEVLVSPSGAITYSIGPLTVLYALSFLAVIVLFTRNLINIPHDVPIKIRQQARTVLVAFVLSALLGLLLNLLLPLTGQDWHTTRLGPLSTVFLVSLTAYAIVRQGLFDIKFAAIRTIGYVLTLATLSVVYFALAYVASITIFKENLATGFSMSPVNIGLALILAFVFQPIKRFFDKTTDNVFYKDRLSTDEFIARLSEVLTSTVELRTLLHRTASEIGSMLKSEQAYFYVEYADGKHVSGGTEHHTHLSSDENEQVMELIESADDIVVADLYPITHPLYKLLSQRSIAMVMPLRHKKDTLGYLALGSPRSGNYSRRDIKLLLAVSNELLIAIQNALSLQEVRDINAHLQEKIKAATEELRDSNSQLKKMDKSKDEFISMASHQLRTPLTAVKGYISMILDGDIGKVTPEQRQVLEQAFESSQRMVFLIGDFLNVSRIQTGKFMLELADINLADLIPEEIDQLIDTAKSRGIELKYEGAGTLPNILADENKMRQVMMNFMDNAIFYSRPNSTIRVQLYRDHDSIVFKVIDTGIGVPKAEQSHLFTKFYRASNARQQRPDGTGIGLYMAKKVIVEHGGSVIFETKENAGSTFGFKLPLKDKLK